jgi:hypothetical protein
MKCTALVPCEKIIIDKDGAHSLINVMLNAAIAVQRQEGGKPAEQTEVPRNAVMPHQWWIYSLWRPSPEDVGASFEQVYQVYWPDGEKFAETRLAFEQKDATVQQTSFYFLGFPVGQEGQLRIVSWLDRGGHRVSDINEAWVRLEHKKPSDPGPTSL